MHDTSTDIFTTATRQEINAKADIPCGPIHYPMQHNIPTMTLHPHDTPPHSPMITNTILPNTKGQNNHAETTRHPKNIYPLTRHPKTTLVVRDSLYARLQDFFTCLVL